MGSLNEYAIYTLMIGIGATMVMDLWGLFAARVLKFPAPNYGLVGRWIGHMPRRRFVHVAIAQAAPVAGERLIGWLAHYSIGIAFAAVLLALYGVSWARHPTILPALIVGWATLGAPFLLMQPGMGAGIAASRTPNPMSARIRSILTHTVFGAGLYGAALVANRLL